MNRKLLAALTVAAALIALPESAQADSIAYVKGHDVWIAHPDGSGADAQLAFYAVSGNVAGSSKPPTPAVACTTGKLEGLAGPSWSPDGRSVAFQQPEGVEVLPLPNVVAGDCPGAGSSTLVLAGASEPDWGPAPVAPGPRESAEVPGGSAQGGGSQGGGLPAGALSVSAKRTLKLKRAAKKGVPFDVEAPAKGELDVGASAGRIELAKGTVAVTQPGTQQLEFQLGKRQAKKLRRRAKTKVAIVVTFRPDGGGAASTAKTTVKLVR